MRRRVHASVHALVGAGISVQVDSTCSPCRDAQSATEAARRGEPVPSALAIGCAVCARAARSASTTTAPAAACAPESRSRRATRDQARSFMAGANGDCANGEMPETTRLRRKRRQGHPVHLQSRIERDMDAQFSRRVRAGKANGGKLCLDDHFPGYSKQNGTQLIVYTCNDGSNQHCEPGPYGARRSSCGSACLPGPASRTWARSELPARRSPTSPTARVVRTQATSPARCRA